MKAEKRGTLSQRIAREWQKNYMLYLMFLPIFIYFLLFAYKPMYGVLMSFQDYKPSLGFLHSKWVGFKHFKAFFGGYYFDRLMWNTVYISLCSLVFEFPAPIILALLINEVQRKWFKKAVQTISYLPHFISLVVVCGMIKRFTLDTGVINDLIALLGGARKTLLNDPNCFVPVYIISDIWQEVGWGSIIYLAALSGVDTELYDAARIDGASRWKQTLHVTLPGIAPTIIIMLILRMGGILGVGYEKTILLYNPLTMKRADVISSYVYREGLQNQNWSYSTAVGLFNSVINLAFLLITNAISKKVSDTALW